MADVLTASIRDKLWHEMRADLAEHAPDVAGNQLLMCVACGRFLTREDFSLEHIIPEQAQRLDPEPMRSNPQTPRNVRAGNLLLCRKPLKDRKGRGYANGCNSWKGRYYDNPIAELLTSKEWTFEKRSTASHLVAALCLGYLAMVAEFGYRVVLMQSGLLLRRQFFHPLGFVPEMPKKHWMVFGGRAARLPHDAPVWAKPFSFVFKEEGTCHFVTRNFGMAIPVSQDPRQPIARRLRFAPSKYTLRPDFTAVFD